MPILERRRYGFQADKATGSAKTAMERDDFSAPWKWLRGSGRIKLCGRVLDYGCGRGFDADNHFWTVGYDPTHRPADPGHDFDAVVCCYVLNTLPVEAERVATANAALARCRAGAPCYIAIRNDAERLTGWTSAGTWQGLVELPEARLIHRTTDYRLYDMRRPITKAPATTPGRKP